MEQNQLGGSVATLQMIKYQENNDCKLSSSSTIQLPVVNRNSKASTTSSSSSATINLMLQKLSKISQSVDTSTLHKNPLNLIQYQMQGQHIRHDPQMVMAKLRKLQNRAQLQRAQNQMHLLMTQQKSLSLIQMSKSKHNNSQRKTSINQNYMKIYQQYLKQKQLSTQKNLRLLPDQQNQLDNSSTVELLMDSSLKTKNGIKYYDALQKHPKLLDLTISKKNQQQGITLLQERIKYKALLTQKLKKQYHHSHININNSNININNTNINNSNININNSKNNTEYPLQQQFTVQRVLQHQKQSKRYFQNPQQVIQRQLTKFYMKKNPGKLTDQAQHNERSRRLMKHQKYITTMIDKNKISKSDKKKLQSKYNDLLNQLAKSDRRKSLEGLLPQLKQLKIHNSLTKPISKQQNNLKRKLFNEKTKKESLMDSM